MLGEPLYVPTTRTIRLRIGATTNPGKLAALATTTAEWDQAVSFYPNIFLEHPGVFEARTTRMVRSGPHAGTTRDVAWTEKDRLTWAESVTVATTAHPNIPPERNREAVCPSCPTDLPTYDVVQFMRQPAPCSRTAVTSCVGRRQAPNTGGGSRNHHAHTRT